MARIKRSSHSKTLAGILALGLVINPSTLVMAQSTSSPASSDLPNQWEDSFNPPPRGGSAPSGREGGATRAPCLRGDKVLTAIVPNSGIGKTVSQYPTFFWYLPPTNTDSVVDFKLLERNREQNQEVDREIYTTRFAIAPKQKGIMSLQLPTESTILPLKAGKQYVWQVVLICKSDPKAGLEGDTVEAVQGSVLPVETPSTLPSQNNTATLQQQLAVYVKSRLWYETLTTLAELRRLNPNDQALADAWTKLLKSVNLEGIAQEPLVFENATGLDGLPMQQTNNVQTRYKQAN